MSKFIATTSFSFRGNNIATGAIIDSTRLRASDIAGLLRLGRIIPMQGASPVSSDDDKPVIGTRTLVAKNENFPLPQDPKFRRVPKEKHQGYVVLERPKPIIDQVVEETKILEPVQEVKVLEPEPEKEAEIFSEEKPLDSTEGTPDEGVSEEMSEEKNESATIEAEEDPGVVEESTITVSGDARNLQIEMAGGEIKESDPNEETNTPKKSRRGRKKKTAE